jgi:hypothetical protein
MSAAALARRALSAATTTRLRGMATLSKSYEWSDPMQLDAQLSDAERAVRDQTAAYAQEKLLPRVTRAFRAESFDREILREMGALGLLGATIEGKLRKKKKKNSTINLKSLLFQVTVVQV